MLSLPTLIIEYVPSLTLTCCRVRLISLGIIFSSEGKWKSAVDLGERGDEGERIKEKRREGILQLR